MIGSMSGKMQKKVMLRNGHTYHSPSGEVPVTIERLKHWQSEHKRLKAAGYLPPMHYDHGSESEMLVPITMSNFKEKKGRSAKNSIGFLAEINLTEDGQAAELVYNVTDEKAAKQLEDGVVHLSPVILPSFTDGAKNKYSDLISHLDVVNYPVDYSQGKAESIESGALVMSLRMGLDDEPYKHEMMDGKASASGLSTVVDYLKKMEICLPADTNAENIIDRLAVALPVFYAANPMYEADSGDKSMGGRGGDDVDTFGNDNGERIVAEHELATTMSAMTDYASTAYREGQQSKLDSMLEKGQMTPAEHKSQGTALGAIKLSLVEGKPAATSVSDFIANRQAVPAGTFWTADQKARYKAEGSIASHPEATKMSLNPDTDEDLTEEKLDELMKHI